MTELPPFLREPHDPRDPNPWLALYLDQSVPMADSAKRAWLADLGSRSRQFLLPVMRPIARLCIVLVQVFRLIAPRAFHSSYLLHRVLAWFNFPDDCTRFVFPEA